MAEGAAPVPGTAGPALEEALMGEGCSARISRQ
jgi:hypothetical protein